MKRNGFRLMALLLALVLCFCAVACETEPPFEDGEGETVELPIHDIAFAELGVPTAEKYPTGERARIGWDTVIYDGKVYMGTGDYGKNRGPAAIACYNTETGTWEENGIVPDEEVNRFCILSGKLCAPGIDPREDWSLGNYYVLENGAWTVKRTISGGVHVFDMVEYDGKLFAGLGVVEGSHPVSVSDDGGESFTHVPFEKKGAFVNTKGYTNVRTYDFFALDDGLYATLTLDGTAYEVYKYNESKDVFSFKADLKGKMNYLRYKQNTLGEKVVFDGSLYLVTGYLYETPDFYNITRITLDEKAATADACVVGDTMYVLTFAAMEDGRYKTAVYALEKGKTEFKEIFDFVYDVPAVSMATTGEDFYISMGHRGIETEKNGMLLHVNINK